MNNIKQHAGIQHKDEDILNISLIKICLINLLFGYTINGIVNPAFTKSIFSFLEVSLVSVICGTIIWKGSIAIATYLMKKYPWLQYPIKRIFFSFLYLFLLSFLSFAIVILIDHLLFYDFKLTVFLNNLKNIALYCVFFPILFGLILYSYLFLRNWKASLLREEILKREQLSLQYESLKTQANPELLFKCLETLKSLIISDKDIAAGYIKKLSEVYRYMLDQRNKEVSILNDELANLRNFYELLKMQNAALAELQIQLDGINEAFVLTLSTQMLLDEVIANNEGNLLSIKLTNNPSNYLMLEFTFKHEFENQLKCLLNIQEGYKNLTNEQVQIVKKENRLMVHFPLINIENDNILQR